MKSKFGFGLHICIKMFQKHPPHSEISSRQYIIKKEEYKHGDFADIKRILSFLLVTSHFQFVKTPSMLSISSFWFLLLMPMMYIIFSSELLLLSSSLSSMLVRTIVIFSAFTLLGL